MFKRCLALLTFLILVLVNATSYTYAHQSHNYSQFLKRLSTNEGLSQSSVTRIAQDNQGFIWLGTRMGLNRYDGYQIKRIQGPDRIFDKEMINDLFVDQAGFIWVATNTAGLYRINTKTLAAEKFVNERSGRALAQVLKVKQASGNKLWLAMNTGSYLLDVDSKLLTNYFLLDAKDGYVRDVLIEGNVLFSATTHGLYQTDIATKASVLTEHRMPNSRNRDESNTKFLIKDDHLGVLVGSVDGLFAVAENNTSKKLISDLNIWDMVRHHDHYMIASDKGFYKFDPVSLELSFLLKFSDSNYNTLDNVIIDVFYDRLGNFWLGGNSQGVMLWSPKTRRFSLSNSPHLKDENVWSILNDEKDITWVGTDKGLTRINATEHTIKSYLTIEKLTTDVPVPTVWGIFEDSEDSNFLWLDREDGLYHFDKTLGTASPIKFSPQAQNAIKAERAYSYYVMDNDHIFFFNSHGHYSYSVNTREITPLTALDNAINPISSQGFRGQLPGFPNSVLLTTTGRLYLYNYKHNSVTKIYEVKEYSEEAIDYIDSWLIDRDNTLWLAVAGEGLIGLDASSFTEKHRIDISNGLKTTDVYSLELDGNNNLWMSSQHGIYQIDLQGLNVQHYDANDGLISDEFNGSASARRADGTLLYGTQLGLVQFDPKVFQASSFDHQQNFPIALSDIEVLSSGRKFADLANQNNQLELAHDEFGLRIQFSTLQFHKQSQTRYDVEIAGRSSLDIHSLRNNELLLPKLPPGNYTVSISAQQNAHYGTSAPLVLEIKSLHAPWSTPAAKFAYVAFAIVLLAIARVASQRRKTVLINAHKIVIDNKKQMELALKSSDSGVWDFKILSDELSQARLIEELGYDRARFDKSFNFHLQRVHPQQRTSLQDQWSFFTKGTEDHWDFTYQLQHKDGHWLWYRDSGRVTERDIQGKPTRVAGTYTNITQTKANEEQAILFGKAFSQIHDGVLVLDSSQELVTANQAFLNVYCQETESPQDAWAEMLERIGPEKEKQFSEIISNLEPRDTWQGENSIVTPAQENVPVLIKINAICNVNDDISHYVIVVSDITIQKQAEQKLLRLAHYDYLTDLPNRQLLIDKANELIKANVACALLFIDLDKFKQVNELYGHTVADNLLCWVSKILKNTVDYYDIVARLNGDEFMILVTTKPTREKLEHLSNRIISQLSMPTTIDSNPINISACVGIASFPQDGETVNSLIKKSDIAMLYAKRAGIGQLKFYSQDMDREAKARSLLEDKLRLASAQNKFTNYYQPIVDNADRRVIGFELLLRWFDNDTMISPGVFIPVAEEIGLISQMTINAIDQALTDYSTFSDKLSNGYISVNLSPIHILQEGLSNSLRLLLAKHDLPASVLRLEITEGTLLADLDLALIRLNELRQCGFKLLLDDFGTGYSSLTYLSRFPVNVIKIDRSFVMDSDSNVQNKQIIKSIMSLANNLQLDCIAEGVETQSQLSYLNSIGCHLIQGYYFSKPMPINDVGRFLSSDLN